MCLAASNVRDHNSSQTRAILAESTQGLRMYLSLCEACVSEAHFLLEGVILISQNKCTGLVDSFQYLAVQSRPLRKHSAKIQPSVIFCS